VSRFAGHSKTSTTLDLYAHEFEKRRERNAGKLLDAAFASSI
jgi:hypothetical protein